MTAALRNLSESTEMRSLVADAQAHGRKFVVHVYHSAEGHPFLIHLKAVPQEAA
jgi:CTP:molybdopterin cytidylyltransferase MocA